MPPARFALYAGSAGVVVLSVRAVMGRAPPLGWAVAVLVAYVVWIACGVFFLRWRVFADAVVRGPEGAQGIALTFDDGPHPRWTPMVLDVLGKYGAKGTFFVVGRKVDEHPDVVRAILERGHDLGVHSYTHDRFLALRSEGRVRADLEQGLRAIERATGKRPLFFRPPVGHTNPIVARVADALDLTIVGWTIGARDGVAFTSPKSVVARIRRHARDGAIVLMHDSPERGDREPAAVRALSPILEFLAAERLAVVPLAPWAQHALQDGAAGKTT